MSNDSPMERQALLPGVSAEPCPPAVVFDSRTAVRRARIRAAIIDGAQLVLVGAVDWLFLHFPHTHVPFVDRAHSLSILAGVNVLIVAYVALARTVPRWRAKRVAVTWTPAERARFAETERRLNARR
jgi:hypothetical protein